ncbi:MAG: hypothetical protein ABIH83_03525 [Candidatus Micrarchaeota archaeon]
MAKLHLIFGIFLLALSFCFALTSCTSDMQCRESGMGTYCINGKCNIICKLDEDCTSWNFGTKCLVDTRVCIWEDVSCTSDEYCIDEGMGNTCQGGVCAYVQEPVELECTNDEDCEIAGTGNVCMDGICGYAQLPADSCISDEDCEIQGVGEVCINNECKYTCSNGMECEAKGAGTICENNICPALRCTNEQECLDAGVGNYCLDDGFCGKYSPPEPNPYLCDTDEDCELQGTGDTCVTGECAWLGVPNISCTYDEDCIVTNAGDVCISGKCEWVSPPDTSCTTDEDCWVTNAGTECIGGMCAYTQPPPPVHLFRIFCRNYDARNYYNCKAQITLYENIKAG